MPAELHSQRHEILQEGLEPQHSVRFALLGSSNQKLGQGDFKKKKQKERGKKKKQTQNCSVLVLPPVVTPLPQLVN